MKIRCIYEKLETAEMHALHTGRKKRVRYLKRSRVTFINLLLNFREIVDI